MTIFCGLTFDRVEVKQNLSDDDDSVEQDNDTQQYLNRVALQKLDDFLTRTAIVQTVTITYTYYIHLYSP